MAIRFTTNEPQTLVFPFGDYREVEGQHGPQFLYTVQANGKPDERLYATPALHRQLQAAGVAAGTLLTITKLDGTDNRYWRVQDGATADADAAPEPLPANQPLPSDSSSPTPPPNGQAPADVSDFAGLEQLLSHCLAASCRVCRRLNGEASFTAEDIRRLGITLFLQCCRKGILPEALRQERAS